MEENTKRIGGIGWRELVQEVIRHGKEDVQARKRGILSRL